MITEQKIKKILEKIEYLEIQIKWLLEFEKVNLEELQEIYPDGSNFLGFPINEICELRDGMKEYLINPKSFNDHAYDNYLK